MIPENKDMDLERLAKHIHYPQCWDVMAYPTVESAIHELVLSSNFSCSDCIFSRPVYSNLHYISEVKD